MDRAAHPIKVIARYLWLTIWPLKLSVDYSYNQIPLARGAPEDWLAYAIVLAVAVVIVLLYRWNRTCFFLACFSFLSFVPASNLFFPIGTMMADRLLYLPSLGLLGCLVLAIYACAQTPKMKIAAPVTLGLITAGFAVRTWLRNPDWNTELTIATADVRVSPNSFKLHRLLASSLFESDPVHSNIEQVLVEQEKSVALVASLPVLLTPPDVYRQAGFYYLVESDQLRAHGLVQKSSASDQRALQALLRCISIGHEGDPQAYLLLSLAYLRLGDAVKAYEAVNKARALDPLNPEMYRQLSDVLQHQHHNDESNIAAVQASAITSLQDKNWQGAADLSERVLRFNSTDYPTAYYLNAMANLHLGNLDQAEKSAREAIRLDSERHNPRTKYVLGLILAEKHDYKRAADLLNAYLEALPNAPDAEIVRRQLREIEQSARAR